MILSSSVIPVWYPWLTDTSCYNGTCAAVYYLQFTLLLLDQELISYRYSSCSSYCCSYSCWGDLFKKTLGLRHFKSDRGEIWQDCSSLQSWTSDMTSCFQDGSHDVISRKGLRPRRLKMDLGEIWHECSLHKCTSTGGWDLWFDVKISKWRSWRPFTLQSPVLPPSERKWSDVYRTNTQQARQFLICSTFVLVLKRASQLWRMLKKAIHCSGDFSHRLVRIILQVLSLMASVITVQSSTWCIRKLVNHGLLGFCFVV